MRTDPRRRQEEDDRPSGASLPARSAQWLLGGFPAEHQDRRRGNDTSNSCCAGLGSIRLSGVGAEAGRIGKEDWRSGAQRARQRAARSRERHPGQLGMPPRGFRRLANTTSPSPQSEGAAAAGARASPSSPARCRRPRCAPLCAPRSRRAPGVSKSGQLMG